MTELTAWYQKKIGNYDKQEWETTVEQRLLHGLTRVPLKSAKLRPELIDVDLVRGSTFPKKKPVQKLRTVVRLALFRVFFFPVWNEWWAAHTSSLAAKLLLLLWLLQLVNVVLYVLAPLSSQIDGATVLIPLCLMTCLGVVHALIVSTSASRNSSHRYRSLNSENRQNIKRRISVSSEENILRSNKFNYTIPKPRPYSETSNESIHSDLTSGKTPYNLKNGDLKTLKIPKVHLTPPPIQTPVVSFDLGGTKNSKDNLSSDDETETINEHVIEHQPLPHIPCAEGDDGFESLNGNNSNGSEIGDPHEANKKSDDQDSDEENDCIDENDNPNKSNNCSTNSPSNIMFGSILRNRGKKQNNICDIDDNEYSLNKHGYEDNNDKWSENVSMSGSGSTVRFRSHRNTYSDGGSSTNLSTEQIKLDKNRLGCRNPWVQELFEQRNSPTNDKKTRKTCPCPPTSSDEEEEEECDTASASFGSPSHPPDWAGHTTNSDCSYSSEPEESEWEGRFEDPSWEPCAILSPARDRVSCTIWENSRILKAHLSAVDISRAVVARAERAMGQNSGGLWPGVIIATILAIIPPITKLLQLLIESDAMSNEQVSIWDLPRIFIFNSPFHIILNSFGNSNWERAINFISMILRLSFGVLVFFLLTVAERAFRQRFLYAKLFSHLTSARRARQSVLPHFRLNKVNNIKTWLSVRSYLKRRGPQRSVDVIVSAAFFMVVLLISFLVIELLKEPGQVEGYHAIEALGWVLALGAFLLQLAALGTKVARKHRCLPVLLTEQINLHLTMERRPSSKERLSVANNVLKLAADLLKELESPFKICGLSTNPYLYTITKVVVLSALSGVLSEILGFKLKLHKIKIK